MKTITLNNWTGVQPGWAIKSLSTNYARRANKYYLAQDTSHVNLFSNPDILSPAQALVTIDEDTTIKNSITDLVATTTGGTPSAWGIGDNKVYKFTGLYFANVTNAGSWPHTINSVQTGKLHDLVIANLTLSAARKQCLLYAYNETSSAGAGKLGRYNITDDSFSDTAYSLTTNTTLDADGSAHCDRPVFVTPSGMLYVGSGYVIDSLDTTTDDAAISLAALDLDTSYLIKSIGYYRDYLIIAAQKATGTNASEGNVQIYFWNESDPSFNFAYSIDDDTVGAIWSDNSELYVFTKRANVGKLRKFNGQTFELVHEIPGSIPAHGATDSYRGGFAFASQERALGNTSEIYVYASLRPGEGKQLFNYGYSQGNITCVKQIYPLNDYLHVTGDSGAGKYYKHTDGSNLYSGYYTTAFMDFQHRSTITGMRFYFPALTSGAAMTIYTATNFSNTYTEYDTITYASDGAVTRKVFNKILTDVDSISLKLSWTPTSGSGAVRPYRIEIDYEPNTNARAS